MLFLVPTSGISGCAREFNDILLYWVLRKSIQFLLNTVPSRKLTEQEEEALFQFVFPKENTIPILVDYFVIYKFIFYYTAHLYFNQHKYVSVIKAWWYVIISFIILQRKFNNFTYHFVLSNSSCPTLRPQECSPSGSSAHGIFQAGISEWVAIFYTRGSSWPRDWICIPYFFTGRHTIYDCATWEAKVIITYI